MRTNKPERTWVGGACLLLLVAVGLAGCHQTPGVPAGSGSPPGGGGGGQKAFVLNAGLTVGDTDTISVIDTSTNTVIATIIVGDTPVAAALLSNGSKLYVANFDSNNVTVINPTTNAVITTIAVGLDPIDIQAAPNSLRVYVANSLGDTVSVIDTTSDTVIATVNVGSDPEALAVLPDSSKVYVANFISDTVSVINAATNTVSATLPTGTDPVALGLTPDGSKLYVVNLSSDNLSIFSTATDTADPDSPLLVGMVPRGIGITANGTRAYVLNNNSVDISVIDTASDVVTNTISVSSSPVSVSFTPDSATALVALPLDDRVRLINVASSGLIADVVVGDLPCGISIDCQIAVNTAGTRAYVPNSGSAAGGNSVSVIDIVSASVVATVPVGVAPSSIVLQP